MVKTTDTGETSLSLETRYTRTLVELFIKQAPQSFAECVREYFLAAERHMYDGDDRVKFVKSEFLNGGVSHTLSDYYRSQNRIETPETEGYALYEQKVHVTHSFSAESKMINTFALIRR